MKPKPNITEKDEKERRQRAQQQKKALLAGVAGRDEQGEVKLLANGRPSKEGHGNRGSPCG